MRLAVIGIRGYPGVQGGVEIHCENLYPHFENKIQVRVYRRKPYLTQLSHMEDEGVEFIDLPSSRIKGLEAVLHTFLCCLHLIFHRVDVVHVHNIGPGMFIPLLKLAGFRVCMTYHSANYEHKKWGAISKCILRMSEYISLNFADRIIFVNKFQLEKFRKRIQEKSYYLPNGINIKERTESKEFLNKIGAQEGEYLLSVGRLTQEKGFDILIKSIQDLPEVKQVVIAGSCDHGSAYFDKLKALDVNKKVIFSGFTTGEDLRELYSNAKLYVLPSINEGFPLVMLEAMSYNLPLVVSDIPATHLVKINADDYAQPGNVEDFAQKIRLMLARQLGPVEYDLREYDWDRIAQQTLDVYRKALR